MNESLLGLLQQERDQDDGMINRLPCTVRYIRLYYDNYETTTEVNQMRCIELSKCYMHKLTTLLLL